MAMADVTIRGAGIFGLSIAWACVMRGARVRVVDPHGVAAGASGGIVGALAPHVPENWNAKKQFQFESLILAERFWHELEQRTGVASGYARTGRIQPLADDAGVDLARARADSAKGLWGEAAHWEVVGLEGPWCPQSPTGLFVRDTLSARIHPRRACACLQAALAGRGIAVEEDAPGDGPTVWATGVPGLNALSDTRPRPVGGAVKGQAALLAYDASEAPQLFAETLHIVPHLDGTVAIGSTTEREFDAPDTTDAQLDGLIANARRVVPALADAPELARWAGLRPRARSRAPMLGAWPDRPGHYIANGGFKIGFGMAPKVAEVMADLVLEGRDSIPAGFEVSASF
jgi:glycine oxidase